MMQRSRRCNGDAINCHVRAGDGAMMTAQSHAMMAQRMTTNQWMMPQSHAVMMQSNAVLQRHNDDAINNCHVLMH
jgi:hypothetical protein